MQGPTHLLSPILHPAAMALAALVAGMPMVTRAQDAPLPAEAFANVRDFGYLWWQNGVQGSRVWSIKTSRYALQFNADQLNLSRLFPLTVPATERVTLTETNADSIPAGTPATTLAFTLTADGLPIAIQASRNNNDDSQLIAQGKFYQRRWQKVKTASGPALDPNRSGLEICAWPDRVSVVLRAIPTTNIADGSLTATFDLNNVFNILSTSGPVQALQQSNGSGYAFLPSSGGATLSVNATTGTVTVQSVGGAWSAGEERSCGFIVYPLANVPGGLAGVVQSETGPVTVTASQTSPTVSASLAARPVTYDADRGFHRVELRNNGGADDRVEIVRVTVNNPGTAPRQMRFNFAKEGGPIPQITGVNCILRDADGYPCGIPVQLSKNWHTDGDDRWEGPWFHGLTMLTVPGSSSLTFEVLMVGQLYGGVPPASHSQLSLVGWGNHQMWDQVAIGAYGEQFCYEPEGDQANAFGTDSRPMLMLNAAGQTRQWTGNFGGFDVLRFFNTSNQQQRHRRVRTWYQRYCPALTQVTYAGELANSAARFTIDTSSPRSADFSRAYHRVRIDVSANVSFNRLVFFQLPADTYSYASGNAHSTGNALSTTPTREWTATFGGNTNVGTPQIAQGRSPWFYTTNGPAPTNFRAANRGFIIRNWRARINGTDDVPPYYVERALSANPARENGSGIDIVPPPGTSSLQAGDFVEFEIHRVIHPRNAADYYGPDTAFQSALTAYANTPALMIREAIGNDVSVAVTRGTLERSYPIQIRTDRGGAEFTVTRGVGYVPITFTGLPSYRLPSLEEKVGNDWIPLDQATAGKDFWQCDYNPADQTWEVTFNVKMDTAFQTNEALLAAPVTRTFRLGVGTPTERWRRTYFDTPANSGTAADTADPDADGRTNLEEYATGTNPNQPDPAPIWPDLNGPHLEVVFQENRNAADIDSWIEWSETLAADSWRTDNVAVVQLLETDSIRRVQATLPAIGPLNRIFVRQRFLRPNE